MENKELKLRLGVFYKSRSGLKIKIYALDGEEGYPIHGAIYHNGGWRSVKWTKGGNSLHTDYDIVGIWTEPLDFDWDCLPAWINKYIAMDEDGDWYSFNDAPEEYYNYWAESELGQKLLKIDNKHIPKNFNGNWKDSLFKNPNIY